MISERLFEGDDNDGDIGEEIEEMDARYADLVALLNSKPDPGVYLAMNKTGLHFWFNFDDLDPLIDILAGFAVAVHDRIAQDSGVMSADATIARLFADCISEAE